MNTIRDIDVNELKPYSDNPRFNFEAIDKVAKSIEKYGFNQPIVVDDDMTVIVGHTRLLAAKQLGLNKVPVLVASGLSDEKVHAYRIADNKTAELSEWNFDKLNDEMKTVDLADFDFEISEGELLDDELVFNEKIEKPSRILIDVLDEAPFDLVYEAVSKIAEEHGMVVE